MSSRHVLLIITGIMLTFGCSALTFSTWTNFQPVVSEAMGMVTSTGAIDTAPFALYITVLYLTMTVVSPMAGKLIQKMDIRIILSVSAALVGIAFILMSIYTEIWHEPLVQEERRFLHRYLHGYDGRRWRYLELVVHRAEL